MSVVQKALWFVEYSLAKPVGLSDLAEVAGLSPYHMARAYMDVTGMPPIRYVRMRKLTVAAQSLAGGAPDILNVALEAGYGSHEAFSRAFRDAFGVTPEGLRMRGNVKKLHLQEAIKMNDKMFGKAAAPKRVQRGAFTIAGLMDAYTMDNVQDIPHLWERFGPHIGSVSGQVGKAAYGLISMNASGFEYVAAVEVSSAHDLPAAFVVRKLPASDYAVFEHVGHVSGIRETKHAIWSNWHQSALIEPAESLPDFEFYGDRFDARTGSGVVEIWIGVKAKG